MESQSTHQQSWHLPVAWVGGDLFNVRRERDSHLCPWGVPRCGDSPRGPPDPCRRKTTEGASEQPGNRRIEMRRPRGSWRFGTIGCSGAIICSLGSEPCANMGRLGAISESSGSGTCGIGLYLCDGGYGARSTQKGSTNGRAGCGEFQRLGRCVPTSGKRNAVVKPHRVGNGRQATGRPGATLGPPAKANVLQAVKGSEAIGALDSHISSNLSPLRGGVFGGNMALSDMGKGGGQCLATPPRRGRKGSPNTGRTLR